MLLGMKHHDCERLRNSDRARATLASEGGHGHRGDALWNCSFVWAEVDQPRNSTRLCHNLRAGVSTHRTPRPGDSRDGCS